MSGSVVLVINLLATWYMVGLIWMVQVVHYRLFDHVGIAEFARYEAAHSRLITPVVGIPMLVELASAAALLYIAPPVIPRWAIWLGLVLVVLIWLSTALIQVPCHQRLMEGFDAQTCRRLLHSNWIRTVLWSVRGGLVAYLAVKAMGQ